MTRIFCEKHGIRNAYSKWHPRKQKHIPPYIAKCGCKFKDIKDITVRTRFWTVKHGMLTQLKPEVQWNWEKKDIF